MNQINLLAIYSEEITFLYNFFLSTLLSNHAATAKAAVRGRRATVGQVAKGRLRGSQKRRRKARGREVTWRTDSGGGRGGGAARTPEASDGVETRWGVSWVGRAVGLELSGQQLAKAPKAGAGAAKNVVGEPEVERRRGGRTPEVAGAVEWPGLRRRAAGLEPSGWGGG
jgi:hypothetical protein